MRFVIQNYSYLNKYFLPLPRIRHLLWFNNLYFFLFFYKFIFYFLFFKINNFFKFKINFFFYKYFFSKKYLFFQKKITLYLIGFYTNNWIKSLNFYFFYTLLVFFDHFSFIKMYWKLNRILAFNKKFILNLPYLSVKTLNFTLTKTIFKQIFFFFLKFSVINWFSFNIFYKNYFNFILLNSNLILSPSVTSYFAPVFNF